MKADQLQVFHGAVSHRTDVPPDGVQRHCSPELIECHICSTFFHPTSFEQTTCENCAAESDLIHVTHRSSWEL